MDVEKKEEELTKARAEPDIMTNRLELEKNIEGLKFKFEDTS